MAIAGFFRGLDLGDVDRVVLTSWKCEPGFMYMIFEDMT